MTGIAFVDGYRNGRSFGEARRFCEPCRDKQYPHRGVSAVERLRSTRIARGVSLYHLAARIGATPAELSAVELGKVPPPDEATLARWLGAIEELTRKGPRHT